MSEDLFENKSKNADIEQAFEDLHSSDPNKRSSAVEMLSTVPLPAIAATSLPILLAALDDKNARVRKAVTTALGLKGDATAIPRILDLLREKWVRNTAIRTLGQFGLPALLPTVNLLQDKDATVRSAAVTILGTIGDTTVIPSLLVSLKDEDKTVRQSAAEALGVIRDASTAPALVRTLTDTEREVRYAAKEALAKMRTESATTIVNALNDKDSAIRSAASQVLDQFRDQIAVPELLNALLNENREVRCAAAEILGYKGDTAAIPALLNALDDESHRVRVAATVALGKLRFFDVSKLTKLLNDQNPDVRVAVIGVLGRTGDSAITPRLLNALDDPVNEVRQEALDALASIRDTTAIPRLLATLGDSNPSIRSSAARALGNIGDTSSVPNLLAILHDANTLVRATAVRALENIGDPRAIASLAELLSDTAVDPLAGRRVIGLMYTPPPTIRNAAARALEEIGRTVGEKTVLFSTYYPKEVAPKVWYPLHLYCYIFTAVREVIGDVCALLSKSVDLYRQKSEQTQQLISEGTVITATPRLDGFQFNPPSATVGFYEDWHRLDFRFRASEEWREKASNGFVTLTVEGKVIADIPLSIYVGDQESVTDTLSITYVSYQTILSQSRESVFISYSHKDKRWLEKIQSMLMPLVRKDLIKIWADTQIEPGVEWREEMKNALASAKVGVLVVSPNFLASDFIAKHELPPLLEAVKQEGVIILWIAVSASMFHETEIAIYQCVNDPSRPLDSLKSAQLNKELVQICEKIKRATNL